MSRHRDYYIAIGLLVPGVLLLFVGPVMPFAFVIGVIWLVLVAPISYKLIRYKSPRKNSLGEIIAANRKDAGTGPLGTGGMLVCFSGIDGSGKTTEAEAIVEEFRDSDVDATHVWARWRPFLSYPFMGVLFVTRGWRRKDYHKSSTIKRIWGYVLIADHLLFFARRIYPHLLRGRVVCIDRYVLDQLVEMKYDGLYRERPAQMLRRLLPTPDVTFLMDVPASVAAERKDDTEEMLDRLKMDVEPIEYLQTRRKYFQEFATESVTTVDTTRPRAETHEEISGLVWTAYLDF